MPLIDCIFSKTIETEEYANSLLGTLICIGPIKETEANKKLIFHIQKIDILWTPMTNPFKRVYVVRASRDDMVKYATTEGVSSKLLYTGFSFDDITYKSSAVGGSSPDLLTIFRQHTISQKTTAIVGRISSPWKYRPPFWSPTQNESSIIASRTTIPPPLLAHWTRCTGFFTRGASRVSISVYGSILFS